MEQIFSNKEYLDSHYLELCGLKIFKKYELKEYKTEQLIDFKRDCVYVAIPNRERVQ